MSGRLRRGRCGGPICEHHIKPNSLTSAAFMQLLCCMPAYMSLSTPESPQTYPARRVGVRGRGAAGAPLP